MNWSRDEKLALYDRIVAALPGIERKGLAMPFTSLNGNMFSFLSHDGVLALRLSREERAAFLECHPGTAVEQHGRLMRDYVAMPDGLFEDEPALRRLFEASLANARTLRPKAPARRADN